MHIIINLVTLAVVINAVCSFNDEEQMQLQTELLKQLPCRIPRPRVIPLTELMNFTNTNCQVIEPHSVVLHRCDYSAGYCVSEKKGCQPVKSEEVTLVVRSYWRHNRGNCKTEQQDVRKISYIHVQAVNHTICGCCVTKSVPK